MSEPVPIEIDPNNPAGQIQEVQPAPPKPATVEAVSAEAWDAALGEWINARVRNSPISGATEAWNHLMGALPYLRTCLNNELKAKE